MKSDIKMNHCFQIQIFVTFFFIHSNKYFHESRCPHLLSHHFTNFYYWLHDKCQSSSSAASSISGADWLSLSPESRVLAAFLSRPVSAAGAAKTPLLLLPWQARLKHWDSYWMLLAPGEPPFSQKVPQTAKNKRRPLSGLVYLSFCATNYSCSGEEIKRKASIPLLLLFLVSLCCMLAYSSAAENRPSSEFKEKNRTNSSTNRAVWSHPGTANPK